MKNHKILCIFFFVLLTVATFAKEYHKKGYKFLSPCPNAQQISPLSTLIFRFDNILPRQISNLNSFVNLTDNFGYQYSGDVKIASDNKTIIFKPDIEFKSGAKISVAITPKIDDKVINPIQYQFEVSSSQAQQDFVNSNELKKESLLSLSAADEEDGARIMPNGVAVPSNFPHINITTNINPSDEYVFIDNRGGRGNPYNVIFDTDGSPVWYLRTTDERRDFKVQKNGTISMFLRDGGYRFGGFDNNFNKIKEYWATDGYSADEHELQVLPDGSYYLIGLRFTIVDMSQYVSGGSKNANVGETIIQGFTANDEKIFDWRAWDNFADIIQYLELDDPKSNSFRFPHMNAIDIDDDGHILLSSRHLSEVTKINRQTGEIIWRLGGPKNQFTFLNDPLNGFKNQHDIRVLGNGHYSVFDNGTSRELKVSRGVEYELDVENKTATLVWEYRSPTGDNNYSHYMSNAQRLPNGNTHINWAVGHRPKATEVTPDGKVVYEMNFVDGFECYRSFRFPWDGNVSEPYLLVESTREYVTLIFNKFGDPDVDYYRIYAGTSSNSRTLIDTSRATLKRLTDFEKGKIYYFRVRAVGKNGDLSPYSNEVSTLVNITDPTKNMVLNGDFSEGKEFWNWQTNGSAYARWRVLEGISDITIVTAGEESSDIQLTQPQMMLEMGENYNLEFDAWSDTPRTIEVMIAMAGRPFTNYSKTSLILINSREKHYSLPFKMENRTDYEAVLNFYMGHSDEDVYLDNVSLKKVVDSKVDNKNFTKKPLDFKLGNFPNPFNATTSIQFIVPDISLVDITLYNVLGEYEGEICHSTFTPGEHQVSFDATHLSSGVYFYHVSVKNMQGSLLFSTKEKLMLIK